VDDNPDGGYERVFFHLRPIRTDFPYSLGAAGCGTEVPRVVRPAAINHQIDRSVWRATASVGGHCSKRAGTVKKLMAAVLVAEEAVRRAE
jgi:hypothetical protein